MKITINDKIIDLNPMLKKGTGFIEIDEDETLIIDHKESVRKILIEVDDFGDLRIVHPVNLLKSKIKINEELNDVKKNIKKLNEINEVEQNV